MSLPPMVEPDRITSVRSPACSSRVLKFFVRPQAVAMQAATCSGGRSALRLTKGAASRRLLAVAHPARISVKHKAGRSRVPLTNRSCFVDRVTMTEIDRRTVTFSQAEGLAPLPQPIALGSVTSQFRALLWAVLYGHLRNNAYHQQTSPYNHMVSPSWQMAWRTRFVRDLHKPADEFDGTFPTIASEIKAICFQYNINLLFDVITYILRSIGDDILSKDINSAFAEARLAYTVRENTIFPAATLEEGATIERFFLDTAADGYAASRSHLRAAGEAINQGDWTGSVRESINAVESAARVIEPRANTLGDALKKLNNAAKINPNLKKGLGSLYDYSSDEQGIRHAKVYEQDANVDRADAVYMLGSCASFVSYLIARQ